MNRTTITFLSTMYLIGYLSCAPQENARDIASETIAPPESYDSSKNYSEPLQKYDRFLQQLDKTDAGSISKAADEFQNKFASEDPNTCDSAFYIFDEFYSEVSGKLSELHEADTTNYDSLVLTFGPGANVKLSEKLRFYSENLAHNGFFVAMTEGYTYIDQDRDVVEKYFYNKVSPVMLTYLKEINKELKEGFGEDGGLVIEPHILADRAVWWETFIKENPAFIVSRNATHLHKIYLNTLITGLDNTPLYYEESGPLSEFYERAYQHLLTQYPKSEAAKKLRPYYDYLIKIDTAQIRKFREANL